MTYEPSRRHFLRHAAVGAAVVGVASAAPQALNGAAEASSPATTEGSQPNGPVAVYVRDYRNGEIAVMVGEHQVIHHDRALASKLAGLAARAE